MRIRHRTVARISLRLPLIRSSRTLSKLPFVAKQVVEEFVAPLCRLGRPDDFQAAGDRIAALAGAQAVLPAEALLLDAGAFGLRSYMRRRTGAVRLAEGVTAGDQCDGFFVVHGHAGKGFADIVGSGNRVRIAIRAFRVYVDQAHLHCSERILEVALIRASASTISLGTMQLLVGHDHTLVSGLSLTVAMIAAQPCGLSAPVDILVRFPNILAPTPETEGLKAHRFEGYIAGEDDQVSP